MFNQYERCFICLETLRADTSPPNHKAYFNCGNNACDMWYIDWESRTDTLIYWSYYDNNQYYTMKDFIDANP